MVYIYSALFCFLLCVNYFSTGLCCMATPNQEAVSATSTKATTKKHTTTKKVTTKKVTTTKATTTKATTTKATTTAAAARAIVVSTAATTIAATTAAASAADQCVTTCTNLGCATGVLLTKGLFDATPVPNCDANGNANNPNSACPIGCACTICKGNTNCAANADAVNYCQSIGCVSGDCDGGIINCLACPTTTTQKTTRTSDAANAACANKCKANGCGSGFIDNFVEPGTNQKVGGIGCTCSVCPAKTPCSSVTTVTNFCRAIGCAAAANDPTTATNNNKDNANNACDFGISACFTC